MEPTMHDLERRVRSLPPDARARLADLLAERLPAAGHRRLVAYCVPRGEGLPPAAELRAALRERLPDFAIPSAFVRLEALPRLPNGKLDRAALPAPGPGEEAAGEAGAEAPRTDAERRLAEIWQRVLRRERIGRHESFFDLGGDSILSLQIVVRAAEAGLRITPKQVFDHPTIAELARLASAAPAAAGEEDEEDAGEVPLTPIQRWFFEQDLADPHHWNQAILVGLRRPVGPGQLAAALGALIARHDALRLRFTGRGAEARAELGPAPEAPLSVFDLSRLPGEAREAALEAIAADLHGSLDLERGSLLRAAWLGAGPEAGERLLLVAHHLATDAVSWAVLLSDLDALLDAAARGEEPRLPPEPTPFRRWARRLARFARGEELQAERDFWLETGRRRPAPLPVDLAGGENTVARARSRSASLSMEDTQALLANRHNVEETLLAALLQTVSEWTGEGALLVDLEGHGRESLFLEMDVSGTVGWFTTLYPVLLEQDGAAAPAALLDAVRERLRRIPRRGIGYGLLRYLSEAGGAEELRAQSSPEISFNYLGRADLGLPELSWLEPLDGRVGPIRSPRGRRRHLLEVNCLVAGGRLRTDWTYSAALHREETLARLADRFLEAVRGLAVPLSTPEAFLALSPQQKGMLFEALRGPGSGLFVEQSVLALHGSLQLAAFVHGWRRLIERHSILRTAIAWDDGEQPRQIVLRRAEAPVTVVDLGVLPKDLCQQALADYLEADRAHGLDLRRAPLMRVAVFRLPGSDHRLVWTVHHIALDGWCRTIVFEELLAFYRAALRGAEPDLGPARPYGDYIGWLARQDLAAAEAFWRDRLRGLAGPATLPPGSEEAAAGAPRFGEASARLSRELTDALRAQAARHRVTLGTLLQGALALLLSRYSGRADVVFGLTVSGRPADLPGVESIVGLFINTLPLSARVPARGPLWEWLPRLQAEVLEMRRYEHCSAGQIHAWSGLPGSVPLYDAALVLENYPPGEGHTGDLGFSVADAEQRGARTGHLFTLVASARSALTLELVHDGRRLPPAAAARCLEHLERILRRVAEAADPDVEALRDAVPDGEIPRTRRPREGGPRPALDRTPPRNDLEAALAGIWAEELGVEEVGVHASLLELGGHSLLATRILGRVRAELGRDLPLRDLFADPTVAGVARALGEREEGGAGAEDLPVLVPRPQEADRPFPLFGIQRLYWLARGGAAEVDTHGANLYVELEIRGGGPDLAELLEERLRRLAAAHGILRAVFLPEGAQRVLAEAPRRPIEVADLRHLGETEAMERVRLVRDEMLHQRAAVDRLPPYELRLHRLADGRDRLHARFEALLLDGDSRDRLLRELVGLAPGEPEAPACSYRDVAVAWEEWSGAEREPFRRSRRFWRERLATLPPPASLPSVLPQGAPFPRRLRYLRTNAELLDRETWQALKARAAAAGVTPSAAGTAAFVRVLGHLGGRRSFCLPVVGSFRPPFHPHVKRVIGNFDTLYPLAVEDAFLPLAELARRLQEETAEALEHRWASGVDVLLELQRRHSGPPVPAVYFNSLVELSGGGAGDAAQPAGPAAIEAVDYGITVPGTLLSCAVAETRGGVLLGLWQALPGALPDELAERFRSAYQDLLRALAAGEDAWRDRGPGAPGGERQA